MVSNDTLLFCHTVLSQVTAGNGQQALKLATALIELENHIKEAQQEAATTPQEVVTEEEE